MAIDCSKLLMLWHHLMNYWQQLIKQNLCF